MKYKLLAVAIAASLGLTGCGQPDQAKEQTNDQVSAVEAPEANDEAELGSFGVDLSARNEAVKPGDDFFMYASGTWYDNYELPADKTRYGAFTGLAERSEEQVKNIIDGLMEKSSLNAEEQLVHDFFVAYMDTDTINEKGIKPIEDVLTSINSIENTTDLTKAFGNSSVSYTHLTLPTNREV